MTIDEAKKVNLPGQITITIKYYIDEVSIERPCVAWTEVSGRDYSARGRTWEEAKHNVLTIMQRIPTCIPPPETVTLDALDLGGYGYRTTPNKRNSRHPGALQNGQKTIS